MGSLSNVIPSNPARELPLASSSIRDLVADGLLHYGFPVLSIAMGQSEGMLCCYIHPRNTFFLQIDFEVFKYLSTSSLLGAGKCIVFFLKDVSGNGAFPMFDFR